MKAHTQTFKENLITLGKEIDAKITYTIDNVETELDGDTLSSVTPHYEGNILKSVMKQVDIISDVDIPLNTEINVQFGMRYNTEQYEYIDYGNYIVFSSEKQEDTNNYKIIAYDKMLYAMKKYEELEITYPITIRNYINAICTKIDLQFANSNDTFANYDKEITQDLYKDLGYTYRDILDELAQVTASTICINEDDELEVRYINNTKSKNLLPTFGTGSGVNVNITSNNYEVTINGSTNNSGEILSANTFILPAGTYRLNRKYVSGSLNNKLVVVLKKVGTQSYQVTSNLTTSNYKTNSSVSFTINQPTELAFGFQFDTYNRVFSNLKFNFQITEGNTADYEFEPNGFDIINEDYIKNVKASFGKKYGPINSIVLSRSAESDNIYLQDEDSIEENGLCEIKIKDNQIMNDDTRDRFLPDILEQLDGLEYYINDFESIGITYLDLCDRYNIKIDDKVYTCIMFNDEVNIHDGLNEIVYTDEPKQSVTDYTKADKTDQRIIKTTLEVDKQANRITALVGETEDSFAQVQIDMDKISSEVQSTNIELDELGNEIDVVRSSITEQTSTAITDWFDTNLKSQIEDLQNTSDSNSDTLNNIKSYIRRGIITDQQSPYYNQAYVEIGDDTNQTTLRILPSRIQFLTNGQETAYISNNQLYINESTILTKEKVGHWVTTEDENGLLNTYWED